jgi:chromosome partitioning protein
MLVIVVANLKGGVLKTTSTGFLCQAFHESGLRVLGVDADGENKSLQSWQADADLPWPVVGMAVPNIHKTLPGVAGDLYDVAVVDTPPMQAQKGTVISALRLATHVLIPMAPTPIEFDRLTEVRKILDDASDLRPNGTAPVTAIMLNRTSRKATPHVVYRQLCEEAGWHVLDAIVGTGQQFTQAWGSPIKRASRTPYGDAANELLDLEPEQEQV